MRQLNITLEDSEYEQLVAQKDGRTWRETLLEEIAE